MLQIIFIIGLFVGTVCTSSTSQHASNQLQGSYSYSHYSNDNPNLQYINNNNLQESGDTTHQNLIFKNEYSSVNNNYNTENQGQTSVNHDNLDYGTHWNKHNYVVVQNVPASQHVEITRFVEVPVVKNIGVPIPQPVAIPVKHTFAVGVPQPFPVHIPVAQYVPIPVVKTVAVAVERKVPYAIEKIIPVPVEKYIPIAVEKYIPIAVEKPYPIHIPIYKHIFHRIMKDHQSQNRRYNRSF